MPAKDKHINTPSKKIVQDDPPTNHDIRESPSKQLSTGSLDNLQGKQRELLDLVDNLRRKGLSSILSLPQIAVVGDQSSGKSSVLEAITQIPFPRKENLCTRFATEIVMRRQPTESITCRINPDPNRSDGEKAQLKAFKYAMTSFEQLPELIDLAVEKMGMNHGMAFSKDVLSIEISGPNRPELTLVDLPGWIHSPGKTQTQQDVDVVQSLIREYIANPRTILLAVISAKNDYSNQIILKECREKDNNGSRTLGVITKPDSLLTSDAIKSWVQLARNKEIFFQLGWHLLRNRADNEQHFPFVQRNIIENVFFQGEEWKDLPVDIKGIDRLRSKLSKLLFNHLTLELPKLEREVDKELTTISSQLELLGNKRGSITEQRVFLAELFNLAQNLLTNAISGLYDHTYFGIVDVDADVTADQNGRRLRAVVQYLNLDFAERMRTRGHTMRIENTGNLSVDDDYYYDSKMEDQSIASEEEQGIQKDQPTFMTRAQAVTWAIKILERSRGRELPGLFNPLMIKPLFLEKSKPWERLATEHASRVHEACHKLLHDIISQLAPADASPRILSLAVNPVLADCLRSAMTELKNILRDSKDCPITYNHYFSDTMQKLQQKRTQDKLAESLQKSVKTATHHHRFENETVNIIDVEEFNKYAHGIVEVDMIKYAAEQAVDALQAYYKDEMKFFVAAVTKQVIERHLIGKVKNLLSSVVLAGYDDETVKFLVSEPEEVAQTRQFLENKQTILQEAKDVFRRATGNLGPK